MGITRGLVKSVFSKNRSTGNREINIRNNMIEKKRWNLVRSYLCGDEFNSLLAENDSASIKSSDPTIKQFTSVVEEEEDSSSVKSSEATVTQLIADQNSTVKDGIRREKAKGDIHLGELNSTSRTTMHEEQAAIVIQSAFRGFLVRCQIDEAKTVRGQNKLIVGGESPSKVSLGTSIEVQTGNSVENFGAVEERKSFRYQKQQKAKAQAIKLKEDWDDSTVSSNISKLRIQKRLEATTRRERALAYAFSQQLRICSKKKQTKSDEIDPNMGWSWLERWMATRLPDASSVESRISQQMNPINNKQKIIIQNRFIDVAGEEKESCGSNEVPALFDSFSITAANEKDGIKPTKDKLTDTTSVSKKRTPPSHQCTNGAIFIRETSPVGKEDHRRDAEKERRNAKQAGRVKREYSTA